jgi:hypothetical protein
MFTLTLDGRLPDGFASTLVAAPLTLVTHIGEPVPHKGKQ